MQRINEDQVDIDWLPDVDEYSTLVALPTTSLRNGVKCYCIDTNTIYSLDKVNTTWIEVDLLSRDVANDTSIITGFIDFTAALAFHDATREFTITGEHNFYINCIPYTLVSSSVTIANTIGFHYIYYVGNTLMSSTTFPGWEYLSVAQIYWFGASGVCADRRHGTSMDYITRQYINETIGIRYHNGLSASFNSNSLLINEGDIWSEDIKVNIPNTTTCAIVYYDTNAWNAIFEQNVVYKKGTNVQYNNNNTITESTDDYYVAYWVIATRCIWNKVISIMGNREDKKLSDAMLNNKFETMMLTNFPLKDIKLLYRVIVKSDGTVANVQDLRITTVATGGNYVPSQHDTLAGILGGGSYHLSQDQYTDLTDGGECTLHYHSTDTESLSTELSSEISSRISVDTVLTNNLSTETSTRTSTDNNISSALSTETSSRISADTVLTNNLSTETSTRTSTDNNISSALSTETSSRISVDTVLTNNLSTETSIRISVDIALSTAINGKSNVTSSTTNGNIKIDNIETIVCTHPAMSKVEVYRNTTQTIRDSTWTKLQFDTEVVDSKNEYNNSSTYRFIASVAGRYLVTAGVGWDSMKGYRAIAIYKNNATTNFISGHGDDTQALVSNSTVQRQTVTGVLELAVNDYVEIFVYQDVGNYNTEANTTRMTITQLYL